MKIRNPSIKTFSNQSIENYIQKKCDFCMYKDIIFGQLQKLKQVINMKNKRIESLQNFISKLSEMAFSSNQKDKMKQNQKQFSRQKLKKRGQEKLNLVSIENELKGLMFYKRVEGQSEISFRESKENTGKFDFKSKEHQFQERELNSRLQRLNELNELKKQLQRKREPIKNKQNINYKGVPVKTSKLGNQYENKHQYDTLRTLSQPQQEGRVGSIQNISDQGSLAIEHSQRKFKYVEQSFPTSQKQQNLIKPSNLFQSNTQHKNTIGIIQEFIKRIK